MTLKITAIKTLGVHARMRNWVFVKVETNQPGLYGWGEATLEWKTKGVMGAVEDLAVLLIGQDPLRIEHLWQVMHRQYFWRGGIVNSTALSGIDQALWDIKGKEAGKPVCELLGGPVRDTLRFYDHLAGGKLEGIYQTTEPEQFAELIQETLDYGFTAVKSMPIPVFEMVESPPALKKAARCVEARRIAALAETYQIAVACHNPAGPISTAASLHVGFATPNYLIQEAVRNDVPWRNDIVDHPVRIERGVGFPPTAPGLGIDINEKEAAKHPIEPEITMAVFHKDGSVADW